MPLKLRNNRRPWEPDQIKTQGGRTVDNSAFYNSSVWRRNRKAYLDAYPLCKSCNKNGKTVFATVVDHITPISHGGDSLDWNNLQGLCDSCHNSKSGKERHGIIED